MEKPPLNKSMKLGLMSKKALDLFTVLCVFFIPFPFYLFPFQVPVTEFLFGGIIGFTLGHIFESPLRNGEISSDSPAMYCLVLILTFVAAMVVVFSAIFKKMNISPNKISIPLEYKENGKITFSSLNLCSFSSSLFAYYLAMMLLKYGFDKIFKAQFYLPEPNILYTPLGQISRDLLFWSSMGTSYFYSFFMGSVEILSGILLLFRKTRIVGALLALGILLNVLAINIGFDITVKLYTAFLLLLSTLLLAPQSIAMFQFFIKGKESAIIKEMELISAKQFPFFKPFLKTFVVLIVFLECLFPYIKNGNFNDDNFVRPYLHGAYQVKNIQCDNDTMTAPSIKRLFIHRHGYLIFQTELDEMQDFNLVIDTFSHTFLLRDYQLRKTQLAYTYTTKDSILTLELNRCVITSKYLDWRRLDAVKAF